MVQLLKDSTATGSLKKKVLPYARFEASMIALKDQKPQHIVDPSLIPIKDFSVKMPLKSLDGTVPLVREVADLDYFDKLLSPMNSFVNLLYVYPISCMLSKHKTIACRIQLRLSDIDVESDGLKCIFNSFRGSTFCSHSITQVSVNSKNPFWNEEVKIMLPFGLTSRSHLFFTFTKVSIALKSGKQFDMIGYACIPFFQDNT
jgi:hypothetical protein